MNTNVLAGAVAALAIGLTARAADLDPTTLPGWESDFHAVTNAAITTHTPLVMIWGNKSCPHCQALEADVQNSTFTAWREQSGYKFCFVLGTGGKDPSDAQGARTFAKTAGGTTGKSPSSYPYVCLYWAKADGSVAAVSFTTESAATVTNRANALFAGYRAVPSYTGGDLAFTNTYAHARLEAEVGFTKYVDVPLVRAADTSGFAGTNRVTATLGETPLLTETVVWGERETSRSVRIAVPTDATAGGEITVTLADGSGAVRGRTTIFLVGERANSTKNPHFIGERTADALGYGEWTMDLDVALEKYNANADAHLMAIASGSLWCPDCVMTDEHILENAAFKTWAVENKVILVDIDVPNFPNTTNSACLLTRVVGRTSDGYISGRGTLATNELERYQSGAGYLSRHMVPDADAAAALERNRGLVGRNTLNGGWNNPDRANQNRTGIPNFFALRRDGSVAGALETFDAIGPSGFKAEYLKRFSELIALADEAGDEFANRSWQTTQDTFAGTGEQTGGTLSALDLSDVYRLDAITDAAARQTITISGTDTNATVTVSLLAVLDGQVSTVATATGRLAEGVSVSGVISSTGDYYIQIAGASEGTLALDSAADSTVTAYTVSGERTAIANPFSNDWIARATVTTLPLYASDGTTLQGTLALTLRKTKTFSARYSNGRKTLATFVGKWNADIAADGTATATIAKGAYELGLKLSAEGEIEATISGDERALTSGVCGLAETYADFEGIYTVAMPTANLSTATTAPIGTAFLTLKMSATATARKRGTFRYAVYLPDGKRLSGATNVTGLDANFGIIPVLKTSGAETFAGVLKIRRHAKTAPSTRAVIGDGTVRWTKTATDDGFTRQLGAYGSYYDKGASLLTGIEDDALTLAFHADTSLLADSPTYGALTAVAGNGAGIAVTGERATVTKTTGFTFKLNRATGLFTGTTKLAFANKPQVSAKYTGVLARGWFSDCDCGEDTDDLIEIENIAFGLGYCIFTDKADRKSVKRSFPVKIGSRE